MVKRKLSEREAEEEEAKAESEVQAIFAAHARAPADQEFSGLGQKVAPLHFRVRPAGARPPQYAAEPRKAGEKSLLLSYFAIRGLGEVQRLMLAEAGAEYDEICHVSGDDAHAQYWRKRSPNGLLPTLSGLGVPRHAPVSQSSAVIRFLGRRFGMAGASELEGARVDTLFETAKDMGSMAPSAWEDEGAKGAKGPWELAKRIEVILEDMPSPADPEAAMNYGQMQLLKTLLDLEAKASGCVKRLSGPLHDFMQAVSSRPRVASHLASAQRFPPTNGDAGKKAEKTYDFVSGPLKRGDVPEFLRHPADSSA